MKAQLIRPFRVLTMITASRDKVLRERPFCAASSRVGFMGFYAEVWQTGWDKGGDRAEGGERLEARGDGDRRVRGGQRLSVGGRADAPD